MNRLLHILITLAVLVAPGLHSFGAHATFAQPVASHAETECPSHADQADHEDDKCPCPQHHDSAHKHGICSQCATALYTQAAAGAPTDSPTPATLLNRSQASDVFVRRLIPGRTATGTSPPSALS